MNAMPALLMAAAAQLWAASAGSEPSVVAGHTTATAKSVAGIREFLGLVVCLKMDSIVAGDVPEGFDPKSVPTVPSTLGEAPTEPSRYELWTVRGCGRNLEVIIRLWYDTSGEERFSLTMPKGWLDRS